MYYWRRVDSKHEERMRKTEEEIESYNNVTLGSIQKEEDHDSFTGHNNTENRPSIQYAIPTLKMFHNINLQFT